MSLLPRQLRRLLEIILDWPLQDMLNALKEIELSQVMAAEGNRDSLRQLGR
jgi:hypothetical protein